MFEKLSLIKRILQGESVIANTEIDLPAGTMVIHKPIYMYNSKLRGVSKLKPDKDITVTAAEFHKCDCGCDLAVKKPTEMLWHTGQSLSVPRKNLNEETEFHNYDCGDIGGGWPHPASAHEGERPFSKPILKGLTEPFIAGAGAPKKKDSKFSDLFMPKHLKGK